MNVADSHSRASVGAAALAAAAEAAPGMEDHFLLFHFQSGSLYARRLGRGVWVDLGVLLGRSDMGQGIEGVIDALWPECAKSTRRTFVAIGHLVAKVAGGMLGG